MSGSFFINQNKTMCKFTCVVCGQKFNEGWEHVFVACDINGKPNGTDCGLMVPKDKAHEDYLRKIERASLNKSEPCSTTCFCGGKIVTMGGGSADGNTWWSTDCEDCGFLVDED